MPDVGSRVLCTCLNQMSVYNASVKSMLNRIISKYRALDRYIKFDNIVKKMSNSLESAKNVFLPESAEMAFFRTSLLTGINYFFYCILFHIQWLLCT